LPVVLCCISVSACVTFINWPMVQHVINIQWRMRFTELCRFIL
jgi:hypothetical protein